MKEFYVRNLRYIIRSANEKDAKNLAEIRVQIDGETENMDREKGEGYIDELGFKQLIKKDNETSHNLFLVCEMNGRVIGFSRCEGNQLKRMAHKAEFGVGVLKGYWGYGIGTNLLKETITWADTNDMKKLTLSVLETNEKAIMLYKNYGFQEEGVLKKDKLLSDGKYYNTVLMARFKE
ncbi:GNAT family N-acetyltransferase [Sutcliffiella horikoshii]|uniref:GNAT family N-acetyltransferase n=1 Tax=Sutcliffiella horikoshii TaxID=79883 RepID=A0AA95B6F8_9BACI|nr:GNAT family N-acetyltransferase [Sutcliffiella horikoshii]TYS58526.1 GNAT family N-acetyltransferase [Sutcliffiella horikoshii]